MQTFAPGSETISTPELDHPPRYSGELPSVADAITLFWAVDCQRNALVAEFGASFTDRIVRYAETDMLGALRVDCEPYIARHLQVFLPGVQASDVQGMLWRGNRWDDAAIDSVEAFEVFKALVTPEGHELAVDSLVAARYRGQRLPIPVYWFLPVYVALALQAEQGPEDDRRRAAELWSRLPEIEGALLPHSVSIVV
jgi:hypothetical protein